MGVTGGDAVVASVYPGGQLLEAMPGGPFDPNCATRACPTLTDGALTNWAPLALTAYELVDGIPNGKNIFTNYSD